MGHDHIAAPNRDGHLPQHASACPLSRLPYDVTDVCFIGDRLGWATTSKGLILHTRDGGRFWQKQNPRSDHRLRGIRFMDERIGFAVGERNTEIPDRFAVFSEDIVVHHPDATAVILKTVDGGLVWHEVSGLEGNTYLNAVSLIDGGLGWAVGDCGTTLFTADGGRTWGAIGNLTTVDLLDVHFLDARVGFVAAGGFDEEFASDAALADFAGGDLDIDPASLGMLLRTEDGGSTWSPIVVLPNAPLKALAFTDRAHGWAVGGGGTVLATVDGGLTWSQQALDTRESLSDVAFSDSLNGWVVGARGTSFYTEDGGRTWAARRVTGDSLRAVHCVDASTAWAAGVDGVYPLTAGEDRAEAVARCAESPLPCCPGGATTTFTLGDSGVLCVREMQYTDLRDVRRFFVQSGLYLEMPRLPFPFANGWARTMDIGPWPSGRMPTADHGLIAEENGAIVGYLAIETAAEHHRRELIRLSVGVAPGARRRGVGSALVHQALEIIDSWLPAIRIECMMYPQDDAGIALLRKYGFTADISLRAYTFRDGEITDVIGMSRIG